MAEDTGAEGTQADPTTQPQVGATQQAQAVSAEPEPPIDPALSIDEARKLRSEHRTLRERAKAAEDELEKLRTAAKAAEDAKLSEQEKLQRDNAEWERKFTALGLKAQEKALRAAVTEAAAKTGFRYTSDALALLDHSRVEYDDEGDPTNVAKLIEDIAKERSDLLAVGKPAYGGSWGGADGGSRGKEPATLEEAIAAEYAKPR